MINIEEKNLKTFCCEFLSTLSFQLHVVEVIAGDLD